MTLAAYQASFARMVLEPALAVRARAEGAAAFTDPALSEAERARLADVACQRGMRVTCVLARANRLSSLVAALPATCTLLKPELNALLDRFWGEQPMETLQALPAGLAFGRFLRDEIAAGRVAHPRAADVLLPELEELAERRAALTATAS
ncbi:MAG TPA: hypothetical protein VK824_03540 [Planctomycetota bacterium]|nr:hypothetical protein [Planctomycetota bacterium]